MRERNQSQGTFDASEEFPSQATDSLGSATRGHGSDHTCPSLRQAAKDSVGSDVELGQKRTEPSAKSRLQPPVCIELRGMLFPTLSLQPPAPSVMPIWLMG